MAEVVVPGSVLVAQFGPVPRSYFATSYPHRIADAAPDDFRLRHYLKRKLEKMDQAEAKSNMPHYVMNVAFFAPSGEVEWNGSTIKDPPGHLWFLYSYMKHTARFEHQWNSNIKYITGRLNSLLQDFEQGSTVSYVAFGPPRKEFPDCMFIRTTDSSEDWDYRWTGLSHPCEMTVQKHIRGGAPDASRNNVWVGGRLRAVTFGHDDSFIVYRGENYDWDGRFPKALEEALSTGKDNKWSINTCVLNPRNPNEYILAFNEAEGVLRVFFAVHQSFMAKFQQVIEQWAQSKGLHLEPHGKGLNNDQCLHDLPPLKRGKTSSLASQHGSQRTFLSMEGFRQNLPPRAPHSTMSYDSMWPEPAATRRSYPASVDNASVQNGYTYGPTAVQEPANNEVPTELPGTVPAAYRTPSYVGYPSYPPQVPVMVPYSPGYPQPAFYGPPQGGWYAPAQEGGEASRKKKDGKLKRIFA